ncbi:MAG: exo-alpha-sialidase [Clostridia bacterium]|nr:exo-alpha-sialidase [Clostridia bacterium]
MKFTRILPLLIAMLLLLASACTDTSAAADTAADDTATHAAPVNPAPSHPPKQRTLSSDALGSPGPFVGYIADADTDTIALYTAENGEFIADIPWDVIAQFPGTDRTREGYSFDWMTPGSGISFYYGEMGSFRWAIVCTGPSAGSGNENVCTSSDGGKTWTVGDAYANYPGTAEGANFASPEIGFISYRYYLDNGPEIARTTDGGATWHRLPLTLPDMLTDPMSGFRMTPLTPTFDGADGVYPIRLTSHTDNALDGRMMYLHTKDGGLHWQLEVPDWLPLPEITLDIADFERVIIEMEIAGNYPAETYRVNITGLSVPLTLTMRDIHITDASAHGHHAIMETPLRTVGNCNFSLFEAEGAIVLESGLYKSGDVYVFTPEAPNEFHPGGAMTLMLHEKDGCLRYERANSLYLQMEQFGALSEAVSPDELVTVSGEADIAGGRVILAAPDRIVSVREYCDLGKEFHAIWKDWYRNILDLYRANLARRGEQNALVVRFDPLPIAYGSLSLQMDLAGSGYLVHELPDGQSVTLTCLDVPFGNGLWRDGVMLLQAEPTETGYTLYIVNGLSNAGFHKITLTGTESLEYDGIASITAEEAIAAGAYMPREAVVTTENELALWHERRMLSAPLLSFYLDLMHGEGNFAGVEVSDFSVTIPQPMLLWRTTCRFTVTASALDTLPPGDYVWTVADIVDIFVDERQMPFAGEFADVPEVQRLLTFIGRSFIWNTPVYGEGRRYPGMHNYICCYYSETGAISWEEYQRIAAAEFGVTDFSALGIEGLRREDGTVEAGAMCGGWFVEVTEVRREDDRTTVVVQLYADCNRLIKSHRIAYHFAEDGRWLGYDMLDKAAREPLGLRRIEDE